MLRLTSVTDAIGQVTILSYELISDPLKVTKITDPFGRSAQLVYDGSNRLVRIVDAIGLVSQFEYGEADFVRAMTTPYGTTTFAKRFGIDGHIDYGIQATDPLGGTEVLEWIRSNVNLPASESASAVPTGFQTANNQLNNYTTYYFDKRVMALHPGDYTKAEMIRWNFAGPLTIWDSVGSIKQPLENRVWYRYASPPSSHGVGAMNRPVEIARVLDDGSTQSYRYEYNSKGLKTRETDPLGRETVYEYDTNEIDLLRVKQKNGSYDLLQSYTYNGQHQPLTVTDAAGQTTTYTYNSAGQVLTMVTPPRGGLTLAQRTTTYTYDTNGYLQSVTGPLPGATQSFTYDGYGRVRTTTGSDGYTLTYEYDALDRVTKVTHLDGTFQETTYNRLDAEGQRDRLGRWTRTFHDALRRVTAVRDPLGRTTTYEWCACGSLDKLIDANGNATRWERDVQGRTTREIRADGAAWDYTYESTTSRIKQRKDPKNQITSYEYFLDDNLRRVTYAGALVPTPEVSYTYDPTYSRLATMTDGIGTTTYSYNAVTPTPALGAGQLVSVDGPLANDTVSYTYDELGRFASRGLSGFVSSFSYDALGRLTTEVSPVGNFTLFYDGVTSRPVSLSYPNGQTTQYTYLPNTGDRRLQQIKHLAPGGATISKYDYTYSAVGNITTWSQQVGANPAKLYTLGYDAADQLTTAKVTGPTPLPVPSRFAYAYDPAGNRIAEQLDDAAMGATYNNRNQLTSRQPGGALLFRGTLNEPASVTVQGKPAQVATDSTFVGQAQVPSGTSNVVVAATDPSGNTRTNTYQVTEGGSTTTYTYDANGNLTSDGTRTFEWDAENRLAAVKQGAVTLATFVYDGQGRRAQKTAGGVMASYVYEGLDVIEERLSTGDTLKYVRGPVIDQHWAMRDGSGVVTYFLADHLGSVVQTTNASGAVTLLRDYDPYGNPLAGAAQPGYAFTGREWDPEAALYYHRARYYDPMVGRFLSQDPIGLAGGINLHTYVSNNPVNNVDPTGEAFVDCAKILAELAAASAKLAQRIAENAANPDPGHTKAIRQLQKRVEELARKAAKHCGEAGKKAASAATRAATRCITIIVLEPCQIAPEMCCNGKFVGIGASCGT
jgi:RHS repeat-associated protein